MENKVKNKLKKAWEWTVDHNSEIIGISLPIISGVVLFALAKHVAKSATVSNHVEHEYCLMPKLGGGKCSDIKIYSNGGVELWLDELKLSEMGTLGEDIMNHVNNISPLPENAKVWALLTIYPG